MLIWYDSNRHIRQVTHTAHLVAELCKVFLFSPPIFNILHMLHLHYHLLPLVILLCVLALKLLDLGYLLHLLAHLEPRHTYLVVDALVLERERLIPFLDLEILVRLVMVYLLPSLLLLL